MKSLPFSKMHGLGNDFVIIDGREVRVTLDPASVRRIGDRHRGVGFDQLVVIGRSASADAGLVFYNTDGSEAGACGNATRCVIALLAAESGRSDVTLETVAGRLEGSLSGDGTVRVSMIAPRLDWADIPLASACDTLAVPLGVDGLPHAVAVSMGNPHAVLFVEDVDLVERLGPELEHHPMFPERANIGFAHVEFGIAGEERIRLRVYERGAGLTLACGSGACAALVAAVRRGLVRERAVMQLDGGELEVSWDGEGPVIMTGPVAHSFTGVLDLDEVGG